MLIGSHDSGIETYKASLVLLLGGVLVPALPADIPAGVQNTTATSTQTDRQTSTLFGMNYTSSIKKPPEKQQISKCDTEYHIPVHDIPSEHESFDLQVSELF